MSCWEPHPANRQPAADNLADLSAARAVHIYRHHSDSKTSPERATVIMGCLTPVRWL